jgi:hypothetical protein
VQFCGMVLFMKSSTLYAAVALGLLSCTSCTDSNDQPVTIAYLSETILKPSCGTINCHSALGRTSGYVFGTVEQTTKTLRLLVTPNRAADSLLIAVMRRKVEPMPPSDAIADSDVELIEQWINDGAKGLNP